MLLASEMVHVDHLSPSPFFPSLLSPPHTLSLASSLLCLCGSQGGGGQEGVLSSCLTLNFHLLLFSLELLHAL